MQSSPIDIASHLLSWLPLFILYGIALIFDLLNGFMRSKTKKHLFIDCLPLKNYQTYQTIYDDMKATKHHIS